MAQKYNHICIHRRTGVKTKMPGTVPFLGLKQKTPNVLDFSGRQFNKTPLCHEDTPFTCFY
jgi:hypothetical protein